MSTRNRRNLIQGKIEQHSRPDWVPLLEAVGHDLSGWFMWMGEILLEDGTSIHAYKHSRTRRYMHLGTDGRDFDYVQLGTVRDPKPGCYRPITRLESLAEAFHGYADLAGEDDEAKEVAVALEVARDHARRGVPVAYEPEFLARQRRFEAAARAARNHERDNDPGFRDLRHHDDGDRFYGDMDDLDDVTNAA